MRAWAAELKAHLLPLWFARTHPDTPWYAKALAVLVAAYAFSPIDLIPDFIPVLGYVDDLLIVPLGIFLAVKLIPGALWQEAMANAQALPKPEKNNYAVAALIVLLWLLCGWAAWEALA